MRASTSLLALFLAACGSSGAAPSEPADAGADAGESFDQRTARALPKLQAALDAHRIPGAALAVLADGEIRLTRGFGVRRSGADGAVAPTTRFVVASLTKTATAMAVLAAAEDGKLDLDAPVQPLVGFHAAGGSPGQVSLHHLLSHQSGLPDWNVFTFPVGGCSSSIADYFAAATLPFAVEPGRVFMYSNAGFALAGRALELAEGRAFEASVSARVLVPAGMSRATFDLETFLGDLDHATPHVANADGSPRPVSFEPCRPYVPSAHLYASIDDLAHLARVLLHGGAPVLSSSAFAAMTTPHVQEHAFETLTYGYGLVIDRWKVDEWGHTGNWQGSRTCMTLVPSRAFAAVLMLNSDVLYPCEPLGDVVDVYLGLEDVAPITLGSDPNTWGGLVGTYRDRLGLGDLVVSRDEQGTLIARFSGDEYPLTPIHRDWFSSTLLGGQELTFWRDGTERAERVVLGSIPALTTFERVP